MNQFLFSLKKFILSFIPTKISDRFVLWIMHVFAMGRGLSDAKTEAHLDANRIGWQRYLSVHSEDPFIEHQNDMEDLYYGKRYRASYNACEVIAAYNALLDLTDHKPGISFPELLGRFERKGLIRKGGWGTDIQVVMNYFAKEGFAIHKLIARQITSEALQVLESRYQTFIMTAYNDRTDILKMIHTVSITRYPDGRFAVHNAGDERTYDSLAQAVLSYRGGQGRAMCLIGISL